MTWTKDEFDKIYSRYLESGLSVRSFCFNEGINESLTYEQRAELRRRVAYPLIRAFEQWMLDEAPKVMPKSPIGKAIEYTYRIYYRLSRYHLDGRYLLDNNLIENSIRPIAIGRKNYHIHKYDNDYSRPLDDFLPATLKERGLV